MRTTLVPTDFSENSAHAAKAAVMLSSKLHTNILLFNNYVKIPVTPHFAGGPWVVDELMELKNETKENLQNLAGDLELLIADLEPEQPKPIVHLQYADGNLGDNIAAIIHEKDIELIVIGARSGSTIDHMLNGSETNLIIDQSNCPVLIIPENVDLKELKKVIFATDFDQTDMKAINYMVKLSYLFNFHIEVVHVNSSKSNTVKSERQIAFEDRLFKLNYPKITYKQVFGKNVIRRLNSLCTETDADILALVHHHRSPIGRILKQSTSKKALSQQKVPLMIFPSIINANIKWDHYKHSRVMPDN